jgi:hypothetical protein
MKDEKQPQVLRLRPPRRASLRMTDPIFKTAHRLFGLTNQPFSLTDQSFNKLRIKDVRSC